LRVVVIEAPLPVMVAVAELRGAAVRDPDLPYLPPVPDRRPGQPPQVGRLPGAHDNIRAAELAEDAVREGVERVRAGADVPDREAPVLAAMGPELVVLAVPLPVHRLRSASSVRGIARRREPDLEIPHLQLRRPGI